MRNNVNSVWTIHRMEQLVELQKRRWSCSQIAAELGAGITRNAVIGKLHRMGITGGIMAIDEAERIRRSRAAIQRKLERRKEKRRAERPQAPVTRPRLEPVLRCVETAPRGVSLIELEPGDCRYPDGEGAEITFCGNPVAPGRSYCAAHAWLTIDGSRNRSRAENELHRRKSAAEHKRTLVEAAE